LKPASGDREPRPRLGISTCLLGEPVRHDGGHKRDRFLTETFGQFVEWVPVCPEVECGLGTPRPAMRLVGDPDTPRLVVSKTGEDLTDRMKAWAKKRLDLLAQEDLCGFVFKSRSPSSGMERVRVYDQHGMPHRTGSGIFARAFMDRFPLLPVEEDGRLHDIGIRENFIERIFCLQRYRLAMQPRPSVGRLVAFHAAHKLQLMAHSSKHLEEMGRLVAGGKQQKPQAMIARYEELLLRALRLRATVKKNVNALQHMAGYFKKQLGADEKKEMVETIEAYRAGYTPLIVPLTLIKHHVRKYQQEYLARQSYLNPHPVELKLRNHA
jgi:uncharacterized protein YbgA (DUF1722 family)/uncharacterized protein YbbK (DUF523 family)